jgi:hypothetical protein
MMYVALGVFMLILLVVRANNEEDKWIVSVMVAFGLWSSTFFLLFLWAPWLVANLRILSPF